MTCTSIEAMRLSANDIHNSNQPVNKTPTELLREIFLMYVGTKRVYAYGEAEAEIPPQMTSLITKRFENSPTKLTHICRRWRLLALDIPNIWSRIAVTTKSLSRSGFSESDRVETWLRRSGTYPLHLTLRLHVENESYRTSQIRGSVPESDLQRCKAFRSIQHSLINHFWHWKSIDFDLPLDVFDDFQLSLSLRPDSNVNKCTLLESLNLSLTCHCMQVPHNMLPMPILDEFQISAPLRMMTTSSLIAGKTLFDFHSGLDLFRDRWTHLNYITFDHPTNLQVMIEILKHCPKAQYISALDVRSSHLPTEMHFNTKVPLILRDLHTLNIGHASLLTPLFLCSTFPSLKTLVVNGGQLRYWEQGTIFSVEEFQKFLKRSDCRLEELGFTYQGIDEQDQIDILTCVDIHRLTKLFLGCGVSTSTLNQIFMAGSSEVENRPSSSLRDLEILRCLGKRQDIELVLKTSLNDPSRFLLVRVSRRSFSDRDPMYWSLSSNEDDWAVITLR